MPAVKKSDCDVFVKTIQSTIIKSCFDVLKEIVFEATLLFDQSGIRIVSMDSSKTSLVHLRLDAEQFEEFQCTSPTPVGVSVMLLHRLIKSATASDTITFLVKKGVTHELVIHIESTTSSNSSYYTIKLLDLPILNIEIPDFEYDHAVAIQSQTFQKIIREMSNLGQTVSLKSNRKRLTLSCEGDFASQETQLGDASDEPDTFSALYTLKYLNLFAKSASVSTNVMVFIDTQRPLVLEYDVGTLGKLKFLLSPVAT
jgi:proliferating cell nuclear antigen